MNVITVKSVRPNRCVCEGCRLAVCSALLLVTACGKATAPDKGEVADASVTNATARVSVGPSEKTFDEMLPEDVVIAVNGVGLTRQECDAILNRMEQTYKASRPNASPAEVRNYRNRRAWRLADEFRVKQLLLQEAKRRNLTPSPASKARMEKVLANRAALEKMTPDAYLRSLDPQDAEAVRADLDEQALILTLREDQFGDRVKITDADIQKARDGIIEYNRRGEATNALVKARGDAICERLRKGEDFAKVADEVSEYQEEEGGYWGEFARGEIDDPAVRHAAFTLPIGAVSDPFDTDEGLFIIKVLDRTGVDAIGATQEATVKLGRILLRLVEIEPMMDDKTLRREVEKKRLRELQGDWLRDLNRQAHLEFPNGTNLWKKATKKVAP